MSKSIKDSSKATNWIYTDDKPTEDQLKLSCLMRIADATEIMSKNYVDMQNDLARHKEQRKRDLATIAHLEHSRAGYKAHLTRAKNKLAEYGENNESN